jgi:uncharacterized repeat protein (TIGR01451 family)
LPDLTISKAHVGTSFRQGQTGAQYTLTVTNAGYASTSGTVTVTDTLPSGLTYSSSSGPFSCSASGQLVTCSTTTPVAINSPVTITLNVNVSATAAPNLMNSAAVACTCTESITTNNTSNTDTVTVVQVADLTISKTHSGALVEGQAATYIITVSNIGPGPTLGTVTVKDTLPSGLLALAMSGSGWSCNTSSVTCTRSTVLASGGSYPAITLTALIGGTGSSITNTAIVSGGGELNTSNDTATDTGTVVQTAQVTIATSPSGLSVTVDGETVTAPHTYTWYVGATHTIATSNQGGHTFSSWSDGGGISHNITVPAPGATYTATFQ